MSVMYQKPNEAGWFYHAPAKKVENSEPVGAPPPSQIPGLGQIEVLEKEVPKEMVFRDTDSEYVRMAKMGGRKDLLTIRPNPETKKEPVSYPRNDWFYLEDNAIEDRARKEEKPWQFMLPDYMVHEGYGATTVKEEQPSSSPENGSKCNAPYAVDNQSQFVQDGCLMTDKRVKLPEARRYGYGIRNAKPMPKGPNIDKKISVSTQRQEQTARRTFQRLPAEPEEPVSMVKLLSHSYQREWQEKVSKLQEKQNRGRLDAVAKNNEAECSEYNNNYKGSSSSSDISARRRSSGTVMNKQQSTETENGTKEPFKISKFKNVPARIGTHQSPEVLTIVGN